MRPVQATLPERQCPAIPRLVPLVCYAVACSHVSTAPRRIPPGPIVPVPQGQFQDQHGPHLAPPSTTQQVRLAPHCSRGARVRPPMTSDPPWDFASDPNIPADQRSWQPPGPAINLIQRWRLWCPGARLTLPQCLGSARRDRCIQRSSHLPAMARSGASRPSAVRVALPLPGCHAGHNATLSGPAGAGQVYLSLRTKEAVLTPHRRGPRAGAAVPPHRGVLQCYPAAARQAGHPSPRLSLTAGPRQSRPAARFQEWPWGPEIRPAARPQPPTSPVCGTHGDVPGVGLVLADNRRPHRSRWIMRPPSWPVQPCPHDALSSYM
ncbi:hypothetical protein NDU88_005174 [Pleurodeles waltl]|uniref:Uncharacterized protein n=1 Tax=Pleurodeles waltl TaxID=8319 RepID=A0AAV7L6R9_PLEWA|nr:hypothetical protein NDU88_005174 [Pleurodeles waltl]